MNENEASEQAAWSKRKWKTRSWLIVVFWCVMASLAIVAQFLIAMSGSEITLPVGTICTAAGAVSSLFMGKRAGENIVHGLPARRPEGVQVNQGV